MSGKWSIESTTLTGKSTSPRLSHIKFYACMLHVFICYHDKTTTDQEISLPNQPLRMHTGIPNSSKMSFRYVVLQIVNLSRSYLIVHFGCPCFKSWLRTISVTRAFFVLNCIVIWKSCLACICYRSKLNSGKNYFNLVWFSISFVF